MLNPPIQEPKKRIPRGLEFCKHGAEAGLPSFSWKGGWVGERVYLELFSRSDPNLPPAVKFSLPFLCSLKQGEKGVTEQAQADKTSSCCDFHED